MKKSEIYKIAQKAVLQLEGLTVNETLEVLKTLMGEEASAKYWEEKEEEKKNDAV